MHMLKPLMLNRLTQMSLILHGLYMGTPLYLEELEGVLSLLKLRVQSHDVLVHEKPLSLQQNMLGNYSDACISL